MPGFWFIQAKIGHNSFWEECEMMIVWLDLIAIGLVVYYVLKRLNEEAE